MQAGAKAGEERGNSAGEKEGAEAGGPFMAGRGVGDHPGEYPLGQRHMGAPKRDAGEHRPQRRRLGQPQVSDDQHRDAAKQHRPRLHPVA